MYVFTFLLLLTSNRKLAKEKSTNRKVARDKSTNRKLAREKSTNRKLAREKNTNIKLAREKSTNRKLAKEKNTNRKGLQYLTGTLITEATNGSNSCQMRGESFNSKKFPYSTDETAVYILYIASGSYASCSTYKRKVFCIGKLSYEIRRPSFRTSTNKMLSFCSWTKSKFCSHPNFLIS